MRAQMTTPSAERRAHVAVRHGREGQAARDAADRAPADLLDHVEGGDDLGRVPPHRVARDGHLPQSWARAHGRAPALSRPVLVSR